jgi:hypothetical protein
MSAKKDKSEKSAVASTNGNPRASQDKPECFVMMPISDPEGYEKGHFGQVFDDLFTPACERSGYRAVRADQVRQTNLIHLDVLQKIIESPMAICDLSSRNPNVMFELGLRQAFDKPVVLVQEIGTPPIFDITLLRYTEYHREMLYRQVLEGQDKIRTAIVATKEATKDSKSINSIVKLLSITHPASLTNMSEGDKDTALLSIILSEINDLKSNTREIRLRQDSARSNVAAPSDTMNMSTLMRIEWLQGRAEELIKKLSTETFSNLPASHFRGEMDDISSIRLKLHGKITPADVHALEALQKLDDRLRELDSMYLNALKAVYSETQQEID